MCFEKSEAFEGDTFVIGGYKTTLGSVTTEKKNDKEFMTGIVAITKGEKLIVDGFHDFKYNSADKPKTSKIFVKLLALGLGKSGHDEDEIIITEFPTPKGPIIFGELDPEEEETAIIEDGHYPIAGDKWLDKQRE
jgi:hypothetical protein